MNDLLPQLPEHEPNPDLWSRIESRLEQTDESLKREIYDLPIHAPTDNLWRFIESDLTGEQTPKVLSLWPKPTIKQIWYGLVAASISLIVSFLWHQQSDLKETIRMEYTVESQNVNSQKELVASSNQMVLAKRTEALIARKCSKQKSLCQRPEVHELRNQLTALAIKQQKLKNERRIFGDDPALVQAQTKIENQRLEVTKELLTLLQS